jgi:hypothetical protein
MDDVLRISLGRDQKLGDFVWQTGLLPGRQVDLRFGSTRKTFKYMAADAARIVAT